MHIRNKALPFALALLLTLPAYSQISMDLGYRRSTETINSAVPISAGIPVNGIFSTALLSEQFPSSRIPVEEISVNFPDMRDAIDTIGILWYLKPENYSNRGEVNIILVGMKADSTKTYYIDNNNDRTFADNEEKFSFGTETEKRILEIRILGSYYNYTLMNPDYLPPFGGASRLGSYSGSWRAASRRPSIGFTVSLISGGGNAEISFAPVESIVESYLYKANIVGCLKPTIGIDFSWLNFHLILTGAFERLQYDETVLYAYSSTIEGDRQRFYDRGNWSISKLHGGIGAEYDIRLFKIYFTPFASYSLFRNLDDSKFDRSVTTAPQDATYHDMYSREAGIKFKVPVADKTILFLKYMYSRSWFDASEFLPAYEPGTYSVNFTQNYFGVGIQQRLFR